MAPKATTRTAIQAQLAGAPDGMTTAQLASLLGKTENAIRVHILTDRAKNATKNYRIARRIPGVTGRRPTIFWALGPGEDEPQIDPAVRRAQALQRYRERHTEVLKRRMILHRVKHRPFSVLMLGLTGRPPRTGSHLHAAFERMVFSCIQSDNDCQGEAPPQPE